jgi:hypothetical protein
MGHRDPELATDTLCDATYGRTFSSALHESREHCAKNHCRANPDDHAEGKFHLRAGFPLLTRSSLDMRQALLNATKIGAVPAAAT